jgi:hypothetical protein
MKSFRNCLAVAIGCFFILYALGCGSSKESALKIPYTLVRTLANTGGGFQYSIALDASDNIYANSNFHVGDGLGITRYVKQSNGQYAASRLVVVPNSMGPIAVSPTSGRLYALNHGTTIQLDVYENNGQLLTSKPFASPIWDIRASNRGDVFILKSLSPSAEQIIRLDEDGNQTGNFNLGRTFFIGAVRLATDTDGNLVVLGEEDTNHVPTPPTVRVYSPQGTLLRETPLAPQTFPDQMTIQGLAIGADGKAYVTSGLGPFRLQVFDYLTGQLLAQMTVSDASQDIGLGNDGTIHIMGIAQIYIYRLTP